ncbi:transcription factor bHLH95-like [Quercus robur]|uniref:transcription factor bHLH95-like n=1 Tax=Quercus robur TaxID=38942 RepID=UPI002163989D|nr:transcription factor bHLH95-like [Quercus robur]
MGEEKEVLVGRKRNRRSGKAEGGGGGGESEHETHIRTERQRRKKMSNMFTSLHALLPQLPAKVDKSTIVNEAVNYIKTLEHTLQTLQKQRIEKLQSGMIVEYEVPFLITSQAEELKLKEEFLANKESSKNFLMSTKTCQSCLIPPCFQTWSSPNVVLNLCGDDAQISVCSPRKPGLLATIFKILEKHKLNLVSAHISSDNCRSLYMIHAHAGGASDEYSEAFSVEELFKLAVGEMNLWLLSR